MMDYIRLNYCSSETEKSFTRLPPSRAGIRHWEFLILQNTLAGLRVTFFAFVALPFTIIQSIQESEVDNLFCFTNHIYPSTVRASETREA